ncbi:oxidoreductase [Candidatus Formimonas warabiya]|uniref:Oxidoreductase n=1 Tax=Formimonas warabiya TaxID=1761012 RepID=A0A3G1KMG7_FORW1|nr:oxidoreductase [Candidatus Formimonas warabiya]ATW23652.1 oxidoreductase [Candidatus Formimonas warabiya]
MSKNGLMIDYEYCTGCHSCEVACKNRLRLPVGKYGIKVSEIGPFLLEAPDKFEWNFIPVPTSLCDMCGDLVAKGEKPACVHHCLGACMDYGPAEELAEKMAAKGKKVMMYIP